MALAPKQVSKLDARPTAILSVDVEDYFHVEAFTDVVSRDSWSGYPSRVVDNTRVLLDLFDSWNVKSTCFVLGWVAGRNPSLVREIVDRGHELACHSYWHRLIYKLTPQEFREDTMLAKDVIEQAGGVAVKGYRAPSFSIVQKSKWALDVLAECGFTYDSSIFPVRHDTYGVPNAPRDPFRIETTGGTIVECPMTTFRLPVGPNLPVGGGGYLRIFPLSFTQMGITRAQAEGRSLVTYLHPWEIDPDQPRMPGRVLSKLRHYSNLSKMAKRLESLAERVRFCPFEGSGLLENAPLLRGGAFWESNSN